MSEQSKVETCPNCGLLLVAVSDFRLISQWNKANVHYCHQRRKGGELLCCFHQEKKKRPA